MAVWTIWMCCGEFEQEDSEEEALSLAASIMNGDNHQVFAVEGPDGQDLTAEAEAVADARSKAWQHQRREQPKPIGRVEIAGPSGNWWGREFVYSEEQRAATMATMTETYGDSRVRFKATGDSMW